MKLLRFAEIKHVLIVTCLCFNLLGIGELSGMKEEQEKEKITTNSSNQQEFWFENEKLEKVVNSANKKTAKNVFLDIKIMFTNECSYCGGGSSPETILENSEETNFGTFGQIISIEQINKMKLIELVMKDLFCKLTCKKAYKPKKDVDDQAVIEYLKCNQSSPYLREIDFSDCRKITNVAVKAIEKRCWVLESINLENCPKLTEESIIKLAKKCRELKNVNIKRNYYTRMAIATLKVRCRQVHFAFDDFEQSIWYRRGLRPPEDCCAPLPIRVYSPDEGVFVDVYL